MPTIGIRGSGIRAGGTPSGITVGSVGALAYNATLTGIYTFTGVVVDGAGAALLLIPLWSPAFSERNEDMSFPFSTFTLNGVAPTAELVVYLQNAGTDKTVQAGLGLWTAPSAGNIVFNPQIVENMTSCGMMYMNVMGLHASPLGVLSRENVALNTTSLAWTITPAASASLVICINGVRNDTPSSTRTLTPTDGTMTAVGIYSQSGNTKSCWNVRYKNAPPAGVAIHGGGVWSQLEPGRLGGMGIELLAA